MPIRKIIGRMPKSYKSKDKFYYPFDAYGDISELGFADQLLLSPEISEGTKNIIRDSLIINAASVSDYYYSGTDQEYWEIRKDFPNLAPPYENFFLEFKAPLEIVSSEHGRRGWDTRNPVGWGLLCHGCEIAKLAERPLDEEYKREIKQNLKSELDAYKQSVISIISRYPQPKSKEEFERIYASLKPNEQTLLASYKACLELVECVERDEWDEFKKLAAEIDKDDRWVLNMMIFTKYINEDEIYCDAPTSFYQIRVQHDGTVGQDSNGTTKAAFYPFGALLQDIDYCHKTTGRNKMQLLEEARDAHVPFYNTALLAISFLHCKNVTVRESPKPQIPRLSKAQPQLVYHEIDIAPMRQILRAEGQEASVGTKKAIHICRGHFAHYQDGRGLFGRAEGGTYWIPQHVRGQVKSR